MPRYLTLIRVDERNVPAQGVSEQLMRRMGELIEEMTRAGVMLETAGLAPTSEGVRLTWSGGRVSHTDGPFTESKEAVGGYAVVRARDRAEALEWTERFLRVHEDYWTVTAEVREIAEG
ncbi:YciI family protein [Streptomyces sp. NPDC014894]|uniref:YciI family protein n=1 Tax=unclassified Streptomyces TaxID=2593676 RepID=UPI0036F7A20C